jgi:hypothetical protein
MCSDVSILMPSTCANCGTLRGRLVNGKVICECGTNRGALSDPTLRCITAIVERFGAPKEPVVLRKSHAIAKIKEQDAFLKRKFTRDGRTWYEILEQASAGPVGDDDHPVPDPDEEFLELP